MAQATSTRGLVIGISASLAFGTSGAFIKPLFEIGWSPAAAVAIRAIVAGLVLAPFAIMAMRGNWGALWRGRWRVLGMGLIGVAGTQFVYYAAVQRMPVSTALLIEYLAPLVLVGWAWAVSRRMPRVIVLVGSIIAITGLVLVIGPGNIGGLDPVGLVFAGLSTVGCALYYVIAARPSEGLPPVAFASAGLILGGLVMGIVGFTGLLPFTAVFESVPFFGADAPWWVPLGIVAIIGTAFAYAASITGAEKLGARLMSFVGLLEVVFATVFAWLLLGESLGITQVLGGVLILAGIVCVRSEREVVTLDPAAIGVELTITESAPPTQPIAQVPSR